MPKPWEGPYFPYFPYFGGQCLFILSRTTKIGEIGTLSLVKCQKHERVPIPPISPKGEVPKPWEGPYFPYFPYFQGLSFHLPKTWTTKIGEIGEIGTFSWFWHFTLRGNRGNRDPLNVFPWWSAKTMKGSLFPLFWWPMSIHPVKTWTTKIGEIGEIGTLSWFWHFTLGGNRGNRDPLKVFPWWSAKTMKGSLFPLFWWPRSWQDDKAWTTKIGEIEEIGTLSWFWHFTLRGNRGNRDPLMVLEESKYVCGYVLTFFGDWLVHASDAMVAMDENMYD